jgi:hypothetical protein
MIWKYLSKPPSREPSHWFILVLGIILIVMASLGFFPKGPLTVMLLFLGLQQIMIASAEVLSTTARISGWLRGLALVPGILAITFAAIAFVSAG